jgi:ribonuclease HI
VTTTAYTDGACLGNPGPGGWAWAVENGPYASGAEARSTNQRMEITAALQVVTSVDGPLLVVTDSTYVANCFRDRWWEGWVRNGWRNSAKKPVANRDLWEPLIGAVRADPKRVRWQWVKGHSGDPMNDLVDRLAVDAARQQQGQRGVGHPEVLGPPDEVRAAGAPRVDDGVPEGHRLVVAGVRPPALGGYGDHGDPPAAAAVRDRMTEILRAKAALYPDLVVLTGLGLGAEQLGAEAAEQAGVPYVGVLAYPEQESVWPNGARARYATLLSGAVAEITLQGKPPETRQKAAAALARRNAWLARNAHEALVVWDGKDDAVGKLVRSFQDHLGEEDVWVVEPAP